LGAHGGDQPGGAPYNLDCTLSSVASHTNASLSSTSTPLSISFAS
jgi:hypothetical protein